MHRSLLRLVPPKDDYVSDSGPTAKAFAPSSEEKKNEVVSVSVWDRARTTREQAEGFRGRSDCRAFAIEEDEIRELAEATLWLDLEVVAEPRPATDGPGADGHCGVRGLGTGNLKGKAYWHRLGLLADLARPV